MEKIKKYTHLVANHYIKQIEQARINGYAIFDGHDLRKCVFYLVDANLWEDVGRLLTDFEFIDIKCANRMVYDLLNEYHYLKDPNVSAFHEMVDKTINIKIKKYETFIRKHAQRLHQYPNIFFSLCYHEGFDESQLEAQKLESAYYKQGKSWLKLTPAWIPPSEQPESDQQKIEILAQYAKLTTVSALSSDRQTAFCFNRLGEIGMVDLVNGKEQQEKIFIRNTRPLTMIASNNGNYLAVAFENGMAGMADVLALRYDSSGKFTESSLLKTFALQLPQFENPTIALDGSILLYQNESGSLVEFNLENDTETIIPMPSEVNRAELSGFASTARHRVFTFRENENSYIVAINNSGSVYTEKLMQTDVSCLCAMADGSIALALTNRTIAILNLDSGLQTSHINVTHYPSCMLALDNNLFWVCTTMNRTAHWWISTGGAGTHKEEQLNSSWDGAHSLALLPDGSYGILTNTNCFRFTFDTGPKKKNWPIYGVFQDAANEKDYYAFHDRPEGLWLLDGSSETYQMALHQGSEPYMHIFAIDGRRNILGVQPEGQGFIEQLDVHSINIVRTIPAGITGVAGDPDGGFWLTNKSGMVYYVSLDYVCREVLRLPLDGAGDAKIYCHRGMLIWEGLTMKDLGFGMDTVDVAVFLERNPKIGIVQMIGERTFDLQDGVLKAVVLDPIANRVLTFWQNNSESSYLKSGTISDYITRREEKIQFEGIDPDIASVRLLLHDRAIYILCKSGNLFRLDLDTFKVQTLYSGSQPVTAIAGGFGETEPLLLTLDQSSLFFCKHQGGSSD